MPHGDPRIGDTPWSSTLPILAAESVREPAEAVEVSRQTVGTRPHEHVAPNAKLNCGRHQVWSGHGYRLQQLVSAAVDVLEDNLGSDYARLRQEAAVHVLKAAGLYGADLAPSGPTDAEVVELERQMQDYGREAQRMASDPDDLRVKQLRKDRDRRMDEMIGDLASAPLQTMRLNSKAAARMLTNASVAVCRRELERKLAERAMHFAATTWKRRFRGISTHAHV